MFIVLVSYTYEGYNAVEEAFENQEDALRYVEETFGSSLDSYTRQNLGKWTNWGSKIEILEIPVWKSWEERCRSLNG